MSKNSKKQAIPTSQEAFDETRTTILSNLRIMNSENNVIEVRILNTSEGVVSGLFSDMETLCEAVLPYNGRHNIFFTLNPCPPDSTASMNKLNPYSKSTTKDSNIVKRDWLLIDIDPKRPSNTSSNDDELMITFDTAASIQDFLDENGFPFPVTAMSGNGMHLLYKISMSNDSESTALIKAFLNALAAEFSNENVDIDKSVYNAARICKLYGTMAVKGKNTAERPHRQSNIADVPETIEAVSADLIERVTALLAPPQPQPAAAPAQSKSAGKEKSGKKYDVEMFMSNNNIEVVTVKDEADYKLWRIVCPFCGEKDAFIQQFNNGAINAGCHHASCEFKSWQKLRARHDLQYAEKMGLAAIPEHLIPYNDMILATGKEDMYIDSGGNIHAFHGSGYSAQWSVLSNFVPFPIAIRHEIDGIEKDIQKTTVEVGGWLEGHTALKPITVSMDKLYNNKWVTELNFKAILYSDVRRGHDRLREVIQLFSPTVPQTTVYTHLGFRRIDGKLCYLHAKGAVGLPDVSVDLALNNLSGYELEDVRGLSAEDRMACMKQSLKVFDVHRHGNVLFAYTFLAPLCDMFAQNNNLPAFSLWLYGKCDTGKSTIAALCNNFFGKGFTNKTLPLSFNDTNNSREKKLSLCKDCIVVIDDVLHPMVADMKRQKQFVQDTIFSVANRAGRGRMNGDGGMRETFVPRGMPIFTAEYPFDNISESTTARLLCLELEKGSVNLDALTECQSNEPSLNKTMVCYIEWLIFHAETLTTKLQRQFEELRTALLDGTGADTNKKLLEVCAFMHIAMDCALQCFIEAGAVDDEYKDEALSRLDADLQTLIEKQSAAIVTASHTKQFIDAVTNMFALGTIYTKAIGGALMLSSGKTWVGWHDNKNYYFPVGENMGAIYVSVVQFIRQHNQNFDIQPKDLYRRLVDEGIITDTEKGRYSKVKTIEKQSWRVLVIPKAVFSNEESTDEDIGTFDDFDED